MIKNILISNGNQPFNQLISDYLLENGHRVTMLFEDDEAALSYQENIHRRSTNIYYLGVTISQMNEEYLQQILADITEETGALDVLIHGNEMVNEEELLLQDANLLDQYITEQFRRIYLLNKTVSSMMIKRRVGPSFSQLFMMHSTMQDIKLSNLKSRENIHDEMSISRANGI